MNIPIEYWQGLRDGRQGEERSTNNNLHQNSSYIRGHDRGIELRELSPLKMAKNNTDKDDEELAELNAKMVLKL